MTGPRIEVHVDELVLHGFASGDGVRVGLAVERELARLLARDRALPSVGRSTATIDAGVFEPRRGQVVEAAGTRVARTIFGSLRP